MNESLSDLHLSVPQVSQYALINKGEPIYIIETYNLGYLMEEQLNMVYTYRVSPESVKRYKQTRDITELQKASEKQRAVIKDRYIREGSTSPLVKASLQFKWLKEYDTRTEIKDVEKPPIYTTVLTNGSDSFTHNFGVGFYDKEPTFTAIENNHAVIKAGENTGIFITLDSLIHIKTYVPTKDITAELSTYGATALYIASNPNNTASLRD